MKLALFFAFALSGCAVEVNLLAPTAPEVDDSALRGDEEPLCHVVCENGDGVLRAPHCALSCRGEGGVATTDNNPVDLGGDPPPTPSTAGGIDPMPGSGGGIPCGNPH